MYRDPIFNLEHSPEFISAFKLMKEVEWEDFLNRLEIAMALQISSATTPEERARVHFRTLMIGELRNFSKSLFSIDNAT